MNLRTIADAKWRRVDDSLGPIVGSLAFAWLMLCCLMSDATNSWLPGIVLLLPLLIIVVLVYRWFRYRALWQYKLFFVPLVEATQIVGNVFNAKGIPFRQVDRLSGLRAQTDFELEDGDLVVVVRGSHDSQQRMARVEIRPYSRDHRPLVQSLQEKIDGAFLPQGLSR